MYLSGGETNPKDGIGRPKVIEFINVPSILVGRNMASLTKQSPDGAV